jgi:hypothetical protein
MTKNNNNKKNNNMKIFTAGCIIITAFLVAWSRHRILEWERWISELERILFQQSDGAVTSVASFTDLPKPVQTFFEKVLPENLDNEIVHYVKIHQEGHFYFGSTWVPFEAYLTFKGIAMPGFIWDATISMTDKFQQKDLQKSLLPTMQVCDAFLGDRAYLRAALVNVFDSINAKSTIMEEDDDQPDEDKFLWVGEAMRWLGESVLTPTAWLPQQGLVTWEPLSDNTAILLLQDPTASLGGSKNNRHVESVRLEVEFDPTTGYIQRFTGQRPYEREVLDEKNDLFPMFTRKRTSWEWRKWEGRLGNYNKNEATGLVVPHYLEAGWMNDNGQIELYYMANNVQSDYKIIKSPAGTTASNKPNIDVAEAVIPKSPEEAAASVMA